MLGTRLRAVNIHRTCPRHQDPTFLSERIRMKTLICQFISGIYGNSQAGEGVLHTLHTHCWFLEEEGIIINSSTWLKKIRECWSFYKRTKNIILKVFGHSHRSCLETLIEVCALPCLGKEEMLSLSAHFLYCEFFNHLLFHIIISSSFHKFAFMFTSFLPGFIFLFYNNL